MTRVKRSVVLCLLLWMIGPVQADPNFSELPIQEVTVFKDGHAFVLHEGMVSTNDQGHVVLGQLPSPILGTFWAYSSDPKVQLKAVMAGKEEADVSKPTRSIQDLIAANVGGRALVQQADETTPYWAVILDLLNGEIEPDLTASQRPAANTPPLVLLKTDQGVKALAVSHIRTLIFESSPKLSRSSTTEKASMTLKLDWGQSQPKPQAKVGMAYVQRGIRWIPGYRVQINGQGKATVKLQATLINELADLKNTTTHLVIGVPEFAFKDEVDPISLQEQVVQLSGHFRQDARTRYGLSNAIMSQRAFAPQEDYAPESSPGIDLGPEMQGSQGQEDLFIFTLDQVTLKKGHRMVVPLAEFELDYQDVYVLDLPFSPPMEMRQRFNSNQQLELSKLLHAPKAVHVLRFKNESAYPITTAPAIILKEDVILAQGMIKYTPIHGTCDLEVTQAVDISVKQSDQQSDMAPQSIQWNRNNYTKVAMDGTVSLVNHRNKAIHLEVRRSILGHINEAGHQGSIAQAGHGFDSWAFEGGTPVWWNWYNWPWWWYHFNAIGRVDWDLTLKPNESIQLTYQWHYFWQA